MKRILKSSAAPAGLSDYVVRTAHNGTWDHFRRDSSRNKRDVQKQLYKDQRGLCAYCEVNIEPEILRERCSGEEVADFQVEHFHPKSDTTTCSPRQCPWGLDWENMFACCLGGTNASVYDATRHCTKANHHCGARKDDKILDGRILNPLTDVPAYPSLFDVKISANPDEILLEPNMARCNSVSSNCYSKASNTILELNLNNTTLNRCRHATLRQIDKRIQMVNSRGIDYDHALELVMREVFDDTSPTWPQFFTTIRARYGVAAERRLKEINYHG